MDGISQAGEGVSLEHQFSRTERLIGKENMERLERARVAVFGIGGVGGHTVEPGPYRQRQGLPVQSEPPDYRHP